MRFPNFVKIFMNTFFTEHHWATISEIGSKVTYFNQCDLHSVTKIWRNSTPIFPDSRKDESSKEPIDYFDM